MSIPLWGGAEMALTNLPAPNLTSMEGTPLHHFDSLACGSCHVVPEPGGYASDGSGWRNGVDVNRSCTSFGCHTYDDKMNHPLDVPVPAGLAGTEAIDLNCLSCHQPAKAPAPDGETQLVLRPSERIDCSTCHERLSGTPRQKAHWKFSQKAHLVTLTPGRFEERADDENLFSEIDKESSTCLSCHDEVTVTVPPLNESRRQKALRFQNMTDHPIGMNYNAMLAQDPRYFHPLKEGQTRIRTFDGRVGCGSCHSLYSSIPSRLSIEYKKSKLCRTCHNR